MTRDLNLAGRYRVDAYASDGSGLATAWLVDPSVAAMWADDYESDGYVRVTVTDTRTGETL